MRTQQDAERERETGGSKYFLGKLRSTSPWDGDNTGDFLSLNFNGFVFKEVSGYTSC